jgi:hypothetical protein
MMMFHRFRLIAAAMLILSLGIVYAGASAATSPRISAHLTSKSFTAAQAGSVNVVYKFSAKSTRFAYVLSRKAGSAWSKVRSVSKRGSFRGSHTMTVKSVFGSKPITVGQYRLKLSSSANSVTLSFTVVKPGTPAGTVKPNAGHWYAFVSGPVSSGPGVPSVTVTSVEFTVDPDQGTVSLFTFRFKYSGIPGPPTYSCSGSNSLAVNNGPSSPIINGHFSTPTVTGPWKPDGTGSGTYEGTFDTPKLAHGTAQFSIDLQGSGCATTPGVKTGKFSWSAGG